MNNLYSSPWAGSQNLQPDFRSELLTMSHLAVAKAYAGKTLPNGAPVINRVLAFAKPLEVFGPPVQAAAMFTQGMKGRAITEKQLKDFPAPITRAAGLLFTPADETETEAVNRQHRIQRAPIASAIDLAISCRKNDAVRFDWHGDSALMPDLSNPMILRAYLLACVAHRSQLRRTGEQFINHPLRVAYSLSQHYSAEYVAAAILHDVIEDTPMTLANLGHFPKSVIAAVDALTKRPGEYYPSFVTRAAANPIARVVKLADVADNSSAQQMAPFNGKKREKLEDKYEAAKLILAPIR